MAIEDDATVDERREAAARALPRGTCVGRYVVLDPIGQGGMGVVYRAWDPELDRPIALKLVGAGDDEAVGAKRDRLLREAQALARLQHPNVVAVHDVGTYRRDVFIAMDFVEGKTLRAWLREKKRPRREILEAFLAAGEGLAAAHRAGLVHRDFKPDNVIRGNDGRVRVLDFGLARDLTGPVARVSEATARSPLVDASELEQTVDARPGSKSQPRTTPAPSQPSKPLPEATPTPPPITGPSGGNLLATPLTRSDAVIGTPRYMAPEQHLGQTIDARADQFSFCMALYHALYGKYPYPRFDPDANAKQDWTLLEPPAGSTVPRWLRQALLRGLAERPEARWPSMEDLLRALRADPAAARRRWLPIVGLVGTSLGLVLVGFLVHRNTKRACVPATERLAGVWDSSRRAEVRQAFAKVPLPYASAALATVEKTFDRYAHDWLAAHTDACEATHVRGEQSQELLDLRMACLEDRLTEWKALSDLFVSADAAIVDHAAQSAQSLPPLDLCSDAAALKAPVPPPRDPATAKKVERIRVELARASALELAGHFDDGLPIAKAALAEAETLDYKPVEAEALLRVGRLTEAKGDYAGSARLLEKAYLAALAGRHEAAATRAAIDLIIGGGTHLAKYDEGERWAQVAEALASRAQRKDEMLGMLYSSRSSLREREGKYAEALKDAERALELEQRVFGPDHYSVAETWYHLGSVHYFRAEHKEALAAYRRCLEIEEKLVGPEHPVLIAAKVGIADVYGDSGDHQRALAAYEEALKFLLRVRPTDPDIAMIRNNLGGELQQLDRPKEAVAQYRLALADWQKRVGPGQETVTALSNIGEAELAMGEPTAALRDFTDGLAMCEKALGATHPLCAREEGWIGEANRRLGKLAEARASFRRAVADGEKALGPKHPQLTVALLGWGRVELALHDAAAARAPLERGLLILGDQPGEGLTLPDLKLALAEALWDSGEHARAVALANAAQKAYAAAGAPGKPALADATAWLARHK